MPKGYRSEALAAVHEVAHGLAEAGAMDKRRLRGFDALCLTPVEPLSPEEIRALRLREKRWGQSGCPDSAEHVVMPRAKQNQKCTNTRREKPDLAGFSIFLLLPVDSCIKQRK